MYRIYTTLILVIFLIVNVLAEEEIVLPKVTQLNDLSIAKEVQLLRTTNVKPLVLKNEQVNLEPYIYYSIENPDTAEHFITFEPFEGKNLKAIRNSSNTTWWYLKVKVGELQPEQKYFLQVGNNKVSEIYIYYLKENNIDTVHTAGLNFKRPITFLSPNMLLPIESGETIEILFEMPPCYIMLDMNMSINLSNKNLPLEIIPAEQKIRSSITAFFSYGVFCGYFILYLFIVSQLISSFRGSLRFLFLLYTISGGLALIAVTGLGYKFIWVDAPLMENLSVSLFSNLFTLSSFMFFIRAAPILWQMHWVRPVYYLCIAIVFLNIIGTCFSKLMPIKWFWLFHDFRGLGYVFCNIMFVLGLYKYWLKVKDKRVLPIITVYFLLVISLSVTVLNSLQIIFSFNTYKFVYVLVMIFAAALTWYLLYRIEILNYRILVKNENRLKAIDVGINLERKRWGNELHDSIGGVISLATLKLSNLESQVKNTTEANELKAIRTDLTKAWEEVNSISKNILPDNLAKLGLQEALIQYVQNLNSRSPIKIETYFKCKDAFKNETLLLHIYRIVQELLHNSLKYAKANQIKLQLYVFNRQLNISVEDDGIGFDVKAVEKSDKATGLSNLKNRIKLTGGVLNMESKPSKGSFIHFSYPMDLLKNPYSLRG